jgi:hypothetical protein
MKAHELDPFASRFGEPKWRDDGTCSYCGSMTPAEALRLMGTDGTKYSGSDWKYGWPHKFYISNDAAPAARKFYTTHLSDCTDEELVKFSRMSDQYFGITWGRDQRGVFYKSLPDMQLWGVVCKDVIDE